MGFCWVVLSIFVGFVFVVWVGGVIRRWVGWGWFIRGGFVLYVFYFLFGGLIKICLFYSNDEGIVG